MATSVTHSEAGNQEADRGNGLLLVSDKVADGCGRRTVSPIAISVIVLACVFGGALLGALFVAYCPSII